MPIFSGFHFQLSLASCVSAGLGESALLNREAAQVFLQFKPHPRDPAERCLEAGTGELKSSFRSLSQHLSTFLDPTDGIPQVHTSNALGKNRPSSRRSSSHQGL
jgi:hypothetical protein